MQRQALTEESCEERAGYFEVPGAHLYTVLHEVANPVARILLVGTFASERHNSYLAWVRWARYLAASNIEVLRYDYRGVGESTGVFEHMGFDTWLEDVKLLCGWFNDRSPHVPLMLHGFEVGALLAGKAFHEGAGDGLILWSPLPGANQYLRSMYLRWIRMKQLLTSAGERKTTADYFQQLEDDVPLSVEGYRWSAKLWHSSVDFDMPPALQDIASAKTAYGRPVHIASLGKDAASLMKGGSIGYDKLRDLNGLFAANLGWIASSLRVSQGRSK